MTILQFEHLMSLSINTDCPLNTVVQECIIRTITCTEDIFVVLSPVGGSNIELVSVCQKESFVPSEKRAEVRTKTGW